MGLMMSEVRINMSVHTQLMGSLGISPPEQGENPVCSMCNIKTPEGFWYPDGEEDWYICDHCLNDMYPAEES